MKRCLVITGGSLNHEWAVNYVRNHTFEFIIAADSGLEYADKLGVKINLIMGDYDSVDQDILKMYRESKLSENIITYPSEKDFTDTELALLRALEYECEDITLIGAIGSRLDHTLANIGIMKQAVDHNITCRIVNQNNMVYMLDARREKSICIFRDGKDGKEILQAEEHLHNYEMAGKRVCIANGHVQYGNYVSILPFGGKVTGVKLEGFKYPLCDYELLPGVGIGISNEIVEETGRITIEEGILIIFETMD